MTTDRFYPLEIECLIWFWDLCFSLINKGVGRQPQAGLKIQLAQNLEDMLQWVWVQYLTAKELGCLPSVMQSLSLQLIQHFDNIWISWVKSRNCKGYRYKSWDLKFGPPDGMEFGQYLRMNLILKWQEFWMSEMRSGFNGLSLKAWKTNLGSGFNASDGKEFKWQQ